MRHAGIEILDHIGERIAGPGERNGVIFAKLHRSSSQPGSFSNFLRAVCDPATRLAPRVAKRSHAVGCGKVGIEFDCIVEQPKRLIDRLACLPVGVRVFHPPQKIVVRVEALGRLALGALDFCILELGRDCAYDASRHLVLQIENIFKGTIESVRP